MADADEGYTSFNYPGQIAGNAFGWNTHGVVISSNQLSPLQFNASGAGYYFILRDTLRAVSVADAVSRVTRNAALTGFSVNIGSVSDAPLNVEVFLDAFRVTRGPLAHFNLYLYMPGVQQGAGVSSEARMARYLQMGSPSRAMPAVLAFLSDQHNKTFPVYR